MFEPLNPTSTRTESAAPETSTPLVMDDDDHERPPEGGGPPYAELLGEVKALRSRNQLLRAERTSMAGRKYALEVVIESLREKLENLTDLCAELDAPGELGDALNEIRQTLGDARRIAESKNVLEGELEEERAARLHERQALEIRVSELQEESIGYRSERDSLRERLGVSDHKLREIRSQLRELQSVKDRAATSLEEAVEAEAKLQQVEIELNAVRATQEARDRELVDLRTERVELKDQLVAAQAAAAAAETRVASIEAEREGIRAELITVQEKLGSQTADSGRLADLEAELATAISEKEASEEAYRQLYENAEAWEARANELEEALTATQGLLNEREQELQTRLEELKESQSEALESRSEAEQLRAAKEAQERELEETRRQTGRLKQDALETDELRDKLKRRDSQLEEVNETILELRPLLDDLDKENRRLSRILGDARSRGRVDVDELLKREKLLRKLDRLASQRLN
ncbi:MAG: hypothetical protein KDD82_26735 [Planctomycetes bacterium]|nr:hypothetical protein [Planctomycetota bacterium]